MNNILEVKNNVFLMKNKHYFGFSTIDYLLDTTQRYRLDINVWYNIFQEVIEWQNDLYLHYQQ